MMSRYQRGIQVIILPLELLDVFRSSASHKCLLTVLKTSKVVCCLVKWNGQSTINGLLLPLLSKALWKKGLFILGPCNQGIPLDIKFCALLRFNFL